MVGAQGQTKWANVA